jgi:betaine-aldehyde dehydrogenase/aminobutyraldehyde dehydrogenase
LPNWSRTTPQQRSNLLLDIANAIEKHADHLARLEALNCGKPLHLARQDDLSATVDVFRFAGAVRCQTGQLSGEYLPGYTSMVRRDPIGVVASIAPWNYPIMMAAWKIARPWPPATRWCSNRPNTHRCRSSRWRQRWPRSCRAG